MEQALGEFDAARMPPLNWPTYSCGRGLVPHAASIWRCGVRVLAPQAVEMALVPEVFLGGELLVEARGLKDDTDELADLVAVRAEIKAEAI